MIRTFHASRIVTAFCIFLLAASGDAALADLRTGFAGQNAFVVSPSQCADGADIGPIIQGFADSVSPGGPSRIVLPAAQCHLKSTVIFKSAVLLEGQGFEEGPGGPSATGTTIVIENPRAGSLIFQGLHARGSIVRDMAFREAQPALTDNWSPFDYDFVIKAIDLRGGMALQNILFEGVTRGFYAHGSGRIDIQKMLGQFYVTGIEIDECLDVARIAYFHSWPFVTNAAPVTRWQVDHLDAIVLRRVDGAFLGDIFSYAARSSLRLTNGAKGPPTKIYLGSLYSDLSREGIWIDANKATLQASNVTTQHDMPGTGGKAIPGGTGLRITADNTVVQVSNWRSDLVGDSIMRIEGSGNVVHISSLVGRFWNLSKSSSPAFFLGNTANKPRNEIHFALPPVLKSGQEDIVRNISDGILRQPKD